MPWTGTPRQSVVPVRPMSTMNAALDIKTLQLRGGAVVECGVARSRVVMFAAIRLRGTGFKPRPRQKFETRFLLHSHPSGGEGVSPVQGEAISDHYI